MHCPIISIVVPVYNISSVFHIMEECLESIFMQTYSNFEVLIVDDGSEDHTFSLLSDWLSNQTWNRKYKVVLLKNEKNEGVSVARNTGIYHATGELISFLDWDDLILPRYFETLVEVFNEKNCSFCIVPSIFYFDYFGKIQKARSIFIPPSINDIPFNELVFFILENNFPAAMGSAISFKTALLKNNNIYYDKFLSKKTAEDILFGLELLNKDIRPFFYNNEHLVIHRSYLQFSSRSRQAISESFELDVFRYMRNMCMNSLIEKVKIVSIHDYLYIRKKCDDAEQTFKVKSLIFEGNYLEAIKIAFTSYFLLKKFIYYLLFTIIDRYFHGFLLPSYSFVKIETDKVLLAKAKKYIKIVKEKSQERK